MLFRHSSNKNNKILGWVVATLLTTPPLFAWATDDTKTYRLIDSEGKPILTGEQQECIQTPNSPNDFAQHFRECGDILDRDGDGVADDEDQCPDNTVLEISKGVYSDKTAAEGLAEKKGCPMDTDGDSIPDHRDECPQTPSHERNCIDEQGCTRDEDHDKVPDCIDQCLHTPLDKEVDVSGCMGITGVTKTILGGDVTFAFGQHELTAQGKLELDKIAHSILSDVQLVEKILIVGYTDSVGSDISNQRLSERRATSVTTYLMSKGISTLLVKQEGRGEKEPIADNNSKIGRAKNRRVEITIRTKM